MAMVTANCWLSRPWMPPMSAMGMNTAESTSAIPTTGPETSDMALSVASRGDIPSSMWCSTASTTTMASSTTSPMARISAKSDRVLIEKPRNGKKMKVPTSDTGTAMSGMSVARQFCRKRKTTRITSPMASAMVMAISRMPSVIGSVVSRPTSYSMSLGKRSCSSAITFLTPSATAMALAPGAWNTATSAAGRPL